MSLVVVTGASGYVGGRLVRHLAEAGHTIRTAGRRPAPPWLAELATDHCVTDLEAGDLARVCAEAAAIVHLAAPNEVEAAADPAGTIATAVTGTRRLATAAATAGVPRFVYLSTIHVYGAALAEDAVVDEDVPAAPMHPYAQARFDSERAAAQEVPADSLVVLRLTNSVGAPAAPDVARWTLLVNDLCREAVTAGTLTLRSAGDQWRDFIAMTDAIRITAGAAVGTLPGGTFNLGSGVSTTVRAVAELVQASVARQTGVAPELRRPEATEPAPRPYRVAVDRLAGHGLRAESDVAAAVDETAAFCIEHQEHLAT